MLNSPETVTRLQPHFQVDWSPESGIRDTHEWVNKEDPDKGGTVGSVLSPGHLRISNVFVFPIHEPRIGHFFPRLINNKELEKLTRRQRQRKRHLELEFALFQTSSLQFYLVQFVKCG